MRSQRRMTGLCWGLFIKQKQLKKIKKTTLRNVLKSNFSLPCFPPSNPLW